jgi:hypothetical protein
VAALYPVLQPAKIAHRDLRAGGAGVGPTPRGPATAGAQPSPASAGATVAGLAPGATGLQPAPVSPPSPPVVSKASASAPRSPAAVRVFREGPNYVYLHPLRAGAQVLAGTVLGHVGGSASAPDATGPDTGGPETAGAEAQAGGPHILFEIRPSGFQAPLIDPKPILDGWVALENASVFRVHGKIRGLLTSREAAQRARQHPLGGRGRLPSAARALNGPQSAERSSSSTLASNQWTELIARLGEIPYPNVATGISAAAIPDKPSLSGASERQARGDG